MADEQLDIDFGDPELNDPDYEKNQEATEGSADGAASQQTTDGAPQQGSDEGANSAAPQQPSGQPDGSAVSKDGAGNNAGQPQQGKPDGAASAQPKPDKAGNLVDKDGKIVAAAGPERRQYERVQAQDRHIRNVEQERDTLRQQLTQAKVLNDAPQQLGLDMQETQMGLQAIASFKKDPVATAKWMLQETMRLGYNLKDIIGADAQGQVNGGSMDLQAIKAMIAEQVGPLIGDRQAAQQQTQSEQAAQREYTAFIAKHDNADVHEDAIASLMHSNPDLSPEVAYWQLREYAAKNGYDFTQPLRAQVEARQSGQQRTPPNGNADPQAQTHHQRPMPNGGATSVPMQNGPLMNEPDDAWDVIVNQSLREAGMMN
jgi:hypothetical protein